MFDNVWGFHTQEGYCSIGQITVIYTAFHGYMEQDNSLIVSESGLLKRPKAEILSNRFIWVEARCHATCQESEVRNEVKIQI